LGITAGTAAATARLALIAIIDSAQAAMAGDRSRVHSTPAPMAGTRATTAAAR
jgi:hypothetical protein